MPKPPWAKTNEIMIRHNFTDVQIRLSQIWASRDHVCPKCEAPPMVACRNLLGIKNFGFAGAKENKYPHTQRVDYDRLEAELKNRGYE